MSTKNETTNANFEIGSTKETLGKGAWIIGQDSNKPWSEVMSDSITIVRGATVADDEEAQHTYTFNPNDLSDDVKAFLLSAGIRETLNNAFAGIKDKSQRGEVIKSTLERWFNGEVETPRGSGGSSKSVASPFEKELHNLAVALIKDKYDAPAMKLWDETTITVTDSEGNKKEVTFTQIYNKVKQLAPLQKQAQDNIDSLAKVQIDF